MMYLLHASDLACLSIFIFFIADNLKKKKTNVPERIWKIMQQRSKIRTRIQNRILYRVFSSRKTRQRDIVLRLFLHFQNEVNHLETTAESRFAGIILPLFKNRHRQKEDRTIRSRIENIVYSPRTGKLQALMTFVLAHDFWMWINSVFLRLENK